MIIKCLKIQKGWIYLWKKHGQRFYTIMLQNNSLISKARALADSCNSLEELKSAVESFEGLDIIKSAKNTVFARGNPNAQVMLIGEAPGADEDTNGIPFCGKSGKLLDEMLHAANLDVYVTNTVFWRPPNNRTPNDEEFDACRPFVEKHIALISPKIIVLVGGSACYCLLDKTRRISGLRGTFHQYQNQYLSNSITTTAIFHPSYVLRQPGQRPLVETDLQAIYQFLLNHQVKA